MKLPQSRRVLCIAVTVALVFVLLVGTAWAERRSPPAATLIGTYTIQQGSNAAGCPPPTYPRVLPTDGNPYQCISATGPGPHYVDARPGRYRTAVTEAAVIAGHPRIWSGTASQGQGYDMPIFTGEAIDFNHTAGQIVLYGWDWDVLPTTRPYRVTVTLSRIADLAPNTPSPLIRDLGSAAGPNGNAGWYTRPVVNQFAAAASAGLADPLQARFTRASGAAEGPAVTINSGQVADRGGNINPGISSAPFKIDLSAPLLNIRDPNSRNFNVCTKWPVRPSFAPSDRISGLDGRVGERWSRPASASGVGVYSYQAYATDVAGNMTSETRTYTVTYGPAFAGIQQPINADGSRRFKLGSTIPITFKVHCNGRSVTSASAKLSVTPLDETSERGVSAAGSTSGATTNNSFRYMSRRHEYRFNLSTRQNYVNPGATTAPRFAPGSWRLGITLDDGTTRSTTIQLLK